MSKVKSIFKRSLAILLAVLTIMSVGLTSVIALNLDMAQTAGYVNLAETGKSFVVGEYLYLKNFYPSGWSKLWIQSSGYYWAHLFNSSNDNQYNDIKFSLYSGTANTEGAIYRAKITTAGNYDKVIYTRCGSNTSPWDDEWNRSGEITISNNSNYIYGWADDGTSCTQSHYAVAPASATLSATGYTGGSGTSADPYLVPAGGSYSVTLKATMEDPGMEGYGLSIDTSASKEISNTTGTYTETMTASTTANTTFSHTGYAWNYEYSTSYYSSSKTSNTLYFKTVATDHDVKFMNGTTQFGATQVVEDGGNATTPATNPTKTGYDFLGWSLTDGGDVVTVEAQTITNDTTFYAVWKAKTYTITYLNDDGSTLLGNGSADYGTKVNVFNNAPTATKAPTAQYEYAFKEWVYENGNSVGTNDTVTGDITLKASYTETTRSYTVNYSGANGTVSVAYANGTVVPSGSAVPYGTTLTLTATPDLFYNVGTWTANGSAVTGTTYTVTGNVELVHTFDAKTSYEVTIYQTTGLNGTVEAEADDVHDFAFDRMYQENGWVYKAEAGATVTFTVTAPNGYYIKEANTVSYTVDDTTVSFTVENVNDKTDINVIYDALPIYNVTVSANDTDAGTVTGGNDAVIHGNKVNLTATPNEGYRFVNWTVEGTYSYVGFVDTLAVTSLIPQSNLTITANFAPITGTINVTAGVNGTVDTEGGEVTYFNPVTATATPNESEGYQFTHWTVDSAGEKDTDYKVTENDDEITVQILTQDTEVNVTANFANSQKIKVYTYSDSDLDRLTIKESNGTKTNTPVDNVTQETIKFGDVTWYTPGEVTLTAGYNDAIKAQLRTSGSSVEGGTIIYVELSDAWTTTDYAYQEPHLSVTSSENSEWSDNISSSDTSGVNRVTSSSSDTYYRADKDTYIGGGTYVSGNIYKFVIPNTSLNDLKTYGFTVYSKKWTSNDMWELNIAHGTYSDDDNLYKVSEANTKNDDRRTFCFSITANDNMPSQTEAIDIKDALYNGNEWRGLDEIWLYFTSDNRVIATDRRELSKTLTSADIVKTYNNGNNYVGWDNTLWGNFTVAYEAAVKVLGDPASEQEDIKDALDALNSTRGALSYSTHVTVYGSNGAEPKEPDNEDFRYGTTSFPSLEVDTAEGNIGDYNQDDWYHYNTSYIYATVDRNSYVTVNTQVDSTYAEDYLVYGWVINGTDWLEATVDTKDPTNYIGTYKCTGNTVFVPIYFRKTTIANWKTDENICKIYANTKDSSPKWGNYISAYTWTNNKTYYQFGHWTGQLMIPIPDNPGMYYTFLEFQNPDKTDNIAGIAFTNYGNNTPINTKARYQTYDYYEFKELKSLGKSNIVFQLKTFDEDANWNLNKSEINLSDFQFDYFRDFSGNLIDINREKIVESRAIPDPELYIVRTGPVKAAEGEGYRKDLITGSDYYIDSYVYDKDGNFLVACKSFELLDLETLFENSEVDLRVENYKGVPVMVDYASLTTSGKNGENKRYDGEWFGTVYGLDKVTVKTEVAYQTSNGTIEYYYGENDVDGVGQAYINGIASDAVYHGSEGHKINAIVADGNVFVGWYKVDVDDDGKYTIDPTADPLITELSDTIDASADLVYVAVFKEHPAGTFIVNNFFYTYDHFMGQPMGEHKPPVFGGDASYSVRDVEIQKIYDDIDGPEDNPSLGRAKSQSQSISDISPGDKLKITIYTDPTYTRDYVYAWYIQANEADGKVNFEEIGTNQLPATVAPDTEYSFTFEYEVEPDVDTITIYSDVVHISPEVTFTYIYNNRYNETKTYVVKHTLTDDELQNFDNLKNNEEFKLKIHNLAPYVGDIYKNVTWEIENISSDATNWTLRASEDDVYTVNVNVNGNVMKTPVTGRFNDTVSLYAKDIDPSIEGNEGIWYLDSNIDDSFTEGVDEILGLGSYYGLVITGDADVCFTNDTKVMNQIILADAVYGYERATDGSGNETINKVYVDYLISMLLNVYTGGFIDVDGDGEQDTETEPTVYDEENTNTPVSLKAIEAAGYEVDYGMVHELLNTFGDNKDDIIKEFYGKESDAMSDTKLTQMLINNQATANGANDSNGALATLLYKYSAIDYKDYATNKNRVIMTFGFDNTEYYRNLYYNVKAYLTISAPETTTMTDDNTLFLFSNTATLNIAEDDKVTNGNATNS